MSQNRKTANFKNKTKSLNYPFAYTCTFRTKYHIHVFVDRYFSRQELRELFELSNTRISSTQSQLVELQRGQRKTDTSLDAHIAYLHTLGKN